MRHQPRFVLLAMLLATVGCDATPSDPLDPVHEATASPAAAVVSEASSFPFWARGPLTTSDAEYVVFYYYVVDPEVVPPDFNLLDFFDFRALGADFAVQALEIRESSGDAVPRKVHLTQVAPVEFWFVPVAVFQAEAEDGFVGVTELLGTGDVVVGHTTRFGEELHPSGGTAQQVFLHTQARGELEAGGSFRFVISGHVNQQTGAFDGVSRIRLDLDH